MTTLDTQPATANATARVLRALAAAGPVADQNLNVVSIDDIRSSLGDRWPSKRDQVWRQVEHFLHRQFRPEDVVLRLDEASVLIVQPGRSRLTAETLAIRAASELTRYFLGDAPFADVLVHRVDGIQDDALRCSPVPRAARQAALMSGDRARWASGPVSRTPILTRLERELSIEVNLAPLLALQSPASAPGRGSLGHLARVAVRDAVSGGLLSPDERSTLQSSDLAHADLTAFRAAVTHRRALAEAPLPLIVPISHHTLGHASLRYDLLQDLRGLSPGERSNLICEVMDLEAGVPESRIAEIAAIARPHCRGLICRMELTLENAQKLKRVGATLSAAPGRHALGEPGLLRLEPLVRAAVKITPAILFHDLAPDLIPVAAAIGVTHCTVKGA